jgi:hypothetical protein
VVEGARLESVYRGNSIEGSNPSLSAKQNQWNGGPFGQGIRELRTFAESKGHVMRDQRTPMDIREMRASWEVAPRTPLLWALFP